MSAAALQDVVHRAARFAPMRGASANSNPMRLSSAMSERRLALARGGSRRWSIRINPYIG